ncbi:ankyrin repeat domain-containing protein 54-like [Chelonus insularis]|uniref:ankyrin repeat domain-containing protein 54-like n=1 Tax=Chelonus insularis TaxID=460826 RepID=UPI00158D7235|nr:ankyrin repeat domain-containing protein 54-like [Chelonus insularis]XP_034943732.1 ankyrin repeat domain-containing protein 54-like [Chelonus insularis]
MTSVDSGVETGNDSNDGVQLENLSNQSLINVSTAVISTEKQIATTQKHEQKLMESEFLTPIANSTVKSFIMTDYNLPKLQFKFPPNCEFKFLQDKAERLEFEIQAMQKRVVLKQNKIRYMSSLKKYDSYNNSMLERRMRRAVTTNNVDLMKEVLEKGLSPNISDHLKRTPLHLAACRGYTDIVKLLLDHGANPNEIDSLSNTPLHLAAVTCKYDVITLLLEAGANVLSSDRHGYNPLQLAQSKLRLLQSCRGSDMNVIKDEVHKIINMLLAYLKKQNNANEQIEELSSFCSRISLSNTQDQVQYDLNGLLASIDALSLTT